LEKIKKMESNYAIEVNGEFIHRVLEIPDAWPELEVKMGVFKYFSESYEIHDIEFKPNKIINIITKDGE